MRDLRFYSPLSGVGGGGAYIDRTVDKVSFVISVKKMPHKLGGCEAYILLGIRYPTWKVGVYVFYTY